ncbi:MAG: tetratricopeptide repeat protein, partial [Gemmatimonadota bacterium]
FKASVVERDEKEAGARRILNLGHTVGHALERAAGYGRLLHGEAVAAGLAWEAVFSARLGVTPVDLADRICRLLGEMGFVLDDAGVPTPAIAAALGADKKRIVSDLEVPMVTAPGACTLRRVPAERLARDLADVRDEVRERVRMPGLLPAGTLSDRPEGIAPRTAVPAEERDLLERVARGEGDAVVAGLEKKVASDPRDVPSIVLLATAYRRLGKAAGAWEMIKEALAQRPSDARAQRIAREIERDMAGGPRTGGPGSAAPLEDVVILDEGKFELKAVDTAAGAPGTGPGPQPAARPPGIARPAPEEVSPGAGLVRTITMADVCWAQGRRDEAREIVAEILRQDPGNPRALAWRAGHEEATKEAGPDAAARKLSRFLETIAKEYGYDISRPV